MQCSGPLARGTEWRHICILLWSGERTGGRVYIYHIYSFATGRILSRFAAATVITCILVAPCTLTPPVSHYSRVGGHRHGGTSVINCHFAAFSGAYSAVINQRPPAKSRFTEKTHTHTRAHTGRVLSCVRVFIIVLRLSGGRDRWRLRRGFRRRDLWISVDYFRRKERRDDGNPGRFRIVGVKNADFIVITRIRIWFLVIYSVLSVFNDSCYFNSDNNNNNSNWTNELPMSVHLNIHGTLAPEHFLRWVHE